MEVEQQKMTQETEIVAKLLKSEMNVIVVNYVRN